MKYIKSLASLALVATVLVQATETQAQTLYSDNFDAGNSSSFWTVNAGTGTHPVDFAFDYNTIGILSAPNSGGSTVGLKLQANTAGGIFAGVSVSPTGQSFLGDYRLRFDMWLNYNGRLDGGGNGSTHLTTAGVGTAGTTAQHANAATSTPDGVWFGGTGDGGSGSATGDYRAYTSAGLLNTNSTAGGYAAGTSGDARNDLNAYYTGFGLNTAPAGQVTSFPQQTNSTGAGALGFAWRDVIIEKIGNVITWTVDSRLIASVTNATLSGNNIFLGQSDINATTSSDPNAGSLLFGLIDNVRVEAVPEPSTVALGMLGVAGLFFGARRRK